MATFTVQCVNSRCSVAGKCGTETFCLIKNVADAEFLFWFFRSQHTKASHTKCADGTMQITIDAMQKVGRVQQRTLGRAHQTVEK